jgi:aryl-alcohol dehydrogenase-like predicted oxidoreductase
VLALGTVQFGLSYGVTNASGQVSEAEVADILQYARDSGIRMLDTASEYGASESVLGNVGVNSFHVVTKFPAQIPPVNHTNWAIDSVASSLQRLRLPHVHGVLFHRPEHVSAFNPDKLQKCSDELKQRGYVQKVGVSVYCPSDLDEVFRVFTPDIVQLPYNAFDQRFRTSGWLDRLSELNVDVHIRSVFLQGVLLEGLDRLPTRFKRWNDQFEHWSQVCEDFGGDRIAVALAAVKHPAINRIVVGVQSKNQLIDIVNSYEIAKTLTVPDVSIDDENLILPTKWND